MDILLRLLLFVFIGYGLLVLFVFLRQDKMVYFPRKHLDAAPSAIGLKYRGVYLDTEDGVRIHGWMVGEEKYRGNGVILFCHGNAGNISHRLDTLEIFHQLEYNVFLFDYRGYGQSQGSPSEQGTYKDAEAAWKFLVETEKYAPGKIILFGRSLGGALAAHLASRHDAAALVLESTFTSVTDLGAQLYPYLPVRLLSRFKYNTRALLKNIKEPVLVVHSPHDELVPFNHGKKLFDAANEPKQFLKISGSHNYGFTESAKTYIKGLKKFFSSLNSTAKSQPE